MSGTVYDNLARRFATIRGLLDKLISEHGELAEHKAEYNPDIVMVGFRDHFWPDLDEGGRQLQSRIRREYDEVLDLARTLLRGLPEQTIKDIDHADEHVREVLEREWTFTKTTSDARKKTHEALDVIVSKIADLYDSSDGTPIYVPDTNAILANPELEEWKFGHRFTIHLTPTVLRELDEMKVHRNPDVAAKAEGVIRRIKGYRDRGGGSLRDPVPLRSGRSTLQAGAVEPNMNETLPWLDPENRDDRIIASVIETMRSHVRSPVTLVTRDLNMQNKASHAAIPYIEPPEAAK